MYFKQHCLIEEVKEHKRDRLGPTTLCRNNRFSDFSRLNLHCEAMGESSRHPIRPDN